MELILYTLRTVAYAIVEPTHIFMLVVLGVTFFLKNKRITMMQRMTIGESINSPLELTLSQISLGIIAGAIVSLLLSTLGIIFDENSGIEIMFMISIALIFVKKKYICFSYSGAILGLISILSGILAKAIGTEVYLNINILSLMTFVGLMNVAEGILVMFDGSRGAIPVFSNKDDKIVGGFAYNRYWALPIAIFIAFSGNTSYSETFNVSTPNWWPLLNKAQTLLVLSSAIVSAIPLYGVIGYNSVSFTKDKIKKPIYSGVGTLIYGILLILVAPISYFGIVGQIICIVFAPLGHEFMVKIQNKIEEKDDYTYVTDENGISVLEVAPASPAHKAGIRRGDKIIEINSMKADSELDVFKILRNNINQITVKIKRISGEIVDLTLSPKNERLGLLLVPRIVKASDKINIDNDDFKKVLEEMKRKR